MKRTHIHFAIGYKSAEVISGMRTSSEILIYIDLESANREGTYNESPHLNRKHLRKDLQR